MKKQPFFYTFVLALTVYSCLVIVSQRAYAGKEVVPGTSPDSGSAIGDKLNVLGTSDDSSSATGDTLIVAPGVDLEIVNNGETLIPEINVPPRVQDNLNRIADHILNQPIPANSPIVTMRNILPGGVNALTAAHHLQSAIIDLGVSPSTAAALVGSLNGLTGESQTVNIHKFNNAVNAYNQILNDSNPHVLQSLGNNPQFLTINSLLQQFRNALNEH
jgi:hypothetical protein